MFGPGSGPTVYSNVMCAGNETAITNCSYTPGGACTDAGVICQRRRCKYNILRYHKLWEFGHTLHSVLPYRSLG